MTIEEMKRAKETLGYSYEKIAELSQMTPEGVRRIFSGRSKKPRASSMEALEAVLHGCEYGTCSESEADGERVHEPSSLYGELSAGFAGKRQGEYSVDDYFNLPTGIRCELIDGVLYNMAEPTLTHQITACEVYSQIRIQIEKRKGVCLPVLAPVSVRLLEEEDTIVVPDFLIVCDRSKIKRWGVLGAPDFVMEVLSPSTGKRDATLKLEKYKQAGVQEYWMLDLHKKVMITYYLEKDALARVYPLSGNIGLHIYGEAVTVNLEKLSIIIDEYDPILPSEF